MQDNEDGPFGLQPDMGQAYRRLAIAHLEAAGFSNPDETIEGLYLECLPKGSEFTDEVESFRGDFEEAMRKAAYVRAIEELAGEDAGEYARLYRLGTQEADRRQQGGSKYTELVRDIPPFNPPSANQYFARFDDHPTEIHEMVYRRAAKMAKARLRTVRGT